MGTLLTALQEVADLGGLPRPTSVISSSDTTTRQLLAIANERGQEAARMYDWPQLIKIATITATASSIQALPADCAEVLDETAWYTADLTPISGPITHQEWQRLTQTSAATIKFSFRVAQTSTGGRGLAFTPTPSGGESISYFYRSKSWAKPQDWATGLSVNSSTWCYSDSQFWKATGAGTTGSTAPTTANLGNDGSVIWAAQSSVVYDKFLADSDDSLIPFEVLKKGVLSRFLRMKGLEYLDLEAEYQRDLRDELAERNGGRTVNLFRPGSIFICEWNIKEGNW